MHACVPVPTIVSTGPRECVQKSDLGQAILDPAMLPSVELAAADMALVVGGVLLMDTAGNPSPTEHWPSFYLSKTDEKDVAESRPVLVSGTGNFVWLLKPGSYVLGAEQLRPTKWSRSRVVPLASLAFKIEPGERATYIGQAAMTLDDNSELVALAINDRSQAAEQIVDAIHPGYSAQWVSRLMSQNGKPMIYGELSHSGCQKFHQDVQWGIDLCLLGAGGGWVDFAIWALSDMCTNLTTFGKPHEVNK